MDEQQTVFIWWHEVMRKTLSWNLLRSICAHQQNPLTSKRGHKCQKCDNRSFCQRDIRSNNAAFLPAFLPPKWKKFEFGSRIFNSFLFSSFFIFFFGSSCNLFVLEITLQSLFWSVFFKRSQWSLNYGKVVFLAII